VSPLGFRTHADALRISGGLKQLFIPKAQGWPAQGLSARAIAKRVGVSDFTIRRLLAGCEKNLVKSPSKCLI
jgi:hypothetical protein